MNTFRTRILVICQTLALGFVAAGCGDSGAGLEPNVPVDPAKLVPASGMVKVRGKPLAGIVVMLMNPSGIPAVGETGSDGRFVLETASQKGALPGKYQVTVSYMVSPKGNPQGLGPRSAMVRSTEMLEAVELMPPEYSDLKQTKLSAEVTQQTASLDFDIPATLEPPKPKEEARKDAEESKPTDEDSKKSQPSEKDDSTATPPKNQSPSAESDAKDTSPPKAERHDD
jgi:hypothetical protein